MTRNARAFLEEDKMEVAAAAAAASCEAEAGGHHVKAVAMTALAPLFAGLAAWVMCGSGGGDDGMEFSDVVRRLSHLRLPLLLDDGALGLGREGRAPRVRALFVPAAARRHDPRSSLLVLADGRHTRHRALRRARCDGRRLGRRDRHCRVLGARPRGARALRAAHDHQKPPMVHHASGLVVGRMFGSHIGSHRPAVSARSGSAAGLNLDRTKTLEEIMTARESVTIRSGYEQYEVVRPFLEETNMDVAAANNEGDKPPAALSTAAVVTMGALSLLFVGLTAWLLRPSGAGDEAEFHDLTWTLSPPICAYLFFWTAALSGAARGAAATAVLARASFLLLLADAGAAMADPVASSAAMFLATLYSAAAAGRAFAERRQLAGTERSAAAAARSAPCYRSRAEERHEQEPRTGFAWAMVFAVAAPFAAMSLNRRMLSPESESETELGFLLIAAGPCLLASRLMALRGGPLEDGDPDGMVSCAIVLVVLCWVAAAVCVNVFAGEVAATVYLWLAAMGTAGYLGYGVAVDARYQQLVSIKRRQPRTAQDASGLLVGRDEEDACSARIW
ncbi:hypothetical protein ACP70R_004045 [Stipagrostis hirtigluma subsp. patula]